MVSFFLFFALRPPPRSAILLLGGRGSRVDTIVENGKGTCKNTTKGSLLVPKDSLQWMEMSGMLYRVLAQHQVRRTRYQMNLEVME